ncbi:hypothetical protein F511_16527 [Dorcoceras hygrometricum]|uniref:Uncharacterized protein n=1 Tax=Dorcoceras hygrometricum TaxID=472368 RepID=A0A2Z7AA59_9LAMI|nr:hypothetical protein F511_16527 [Dorcoceras hygrometricum]
MRSVVTNHGPGSNPRSSVFNILDRHRPTIFKCPPTKSSNLHLNFHDKPEQNLEGKISRPNNQPEITSDVRPPPPACSVRHTAARRPATSAARPCHARQQVAQYRATVARGMLPPVVRLEAITRPARDMVSAVARPAHNFERAHVLAVVVGAWLQPDLQENWLFTVGGGRFSNQVHDRIQSSSNQPALESLWILARSETPLRGDRNKSDHEAGGGRRRKAAAGGVREAWRGGAAELGARVRNHESSTCVTLNGSGIQLAVGPQPLWLRNHNFGLAHRIMVKRLATSPHDPLGITDSACKNQMVLVSVQYGPFNAYHDQINDHCTLARDLYTIIPSDSIGYPRMRASGESSTTMHRLLHASGSHQIPPPNDPKRLDASKKPSVPKRKSKKRRLRLPKGSDDENVETPVTVEVAVESVDVQRAETAVDISEEETVSVFEKSEPTVANVPVAESATEEVIPTSADDVDLIIEKVIAETAQMGADDEEIDIGGATLSGSAVGSQEVEKLMNLNFG